MEKAGWQLIGELKANAKKSAYSKVKVKAGDNEIVCTYKYRPYGDVYHYRINGEPSLNCRVMKLLEDNQ